MTLQELFRKSSFARAWAYELKKDESRYDEESFKKKVDIMVQQTPELHKMKIHIGSLSKSDM